TKAGRLLAGRFALDALVRRRAAGGSLSGGRLTEFFFEPARFAARFALAGPARICGSPFAALPFLRFECQTASPAAISSIVRPVLMLVVSVSTEGAPPRRM